jgi:hypothetical protein
MRRVTLVVRCGFGKLSALNSGASLSVQLMGVKVCAHTLRYQITNGLATANATTNIGRRDLNHRCFHHPGLKPGELIAGQRR